MDEGEVFSGCGVFSILRLAGVGVSGLSLVGLLSNTLLDRKSSNSANLEARRLFSGDLLSRESLSLPMG